MTTTTEALLEVASSAQVDTANILKHGQDDRLLKPTP